MHSLLRKKCNCQILFSIWDFFTFSLLWEIWSRTSFAALSSFHSLKLFNSNDLFLLFRVHRSRFLRALPQCPGILVSSFNLTIHSKCSLILGGLLILPRVYSYNDGTNTPTEIRHSLKQGKYYHLAAHSGSINKPDCLFSWLGCILECLLISDIEMKAPELSQSPLVLQIIIFHQINSTWCCSQTISTPKRCS